MLKFKKLLIFILGFVIFSSNNVQGSKLLSKITRPKTFVLLHGAWHGSWCWGKLTPKLKEYGHRVLTPDLPGHNLNKTNFQDINLNTYVKYTENLLNQIDDKVILVGHSMSGVILTQVAEICPEAIDHLVYLCAFIPDNGGSLIDEEQKASHPSVAKEVKIDESASAITFKSTAPLKQLFYTYCNEVDTKFALSRFQPQPLLPFLDKVSISQRYKQVPKTYIECLKDEAIRIEDQRRMHRKFQCDVKAIDTDHSPFFSSVNELGETLDFIAQGSHKEDYLEVKLIPIQLEDA